MSAVLFWPACARSRRSQLFQTEPRSYFSAVAQGSRFQLLGATHLQLHACTSQSHTARAARERSELEPWKWNHRTTPYGTPDVLPG